MKQGPTIPLGVDLDARARERYKRTKRLEWSIQTWGDRQDDIGRMIELLKGALTETKDELNQLERELGYRIKERVHE